MSNKPSNTQYSKIFNRIASKYDSILNPYALSRRIKFIIDNSTGKCLEVGAGTGIISSKLAPKHVVVATDISPRMVREITKVKHIKAFICDAEKLPFKDKSFDTVIAAETIYYMDHPDKFISEAYRVLRKNGRLLITSANNITVIYDAIRSIFRLVGLKSMYFDDPNRQFMSLEKITNLIKTKPFSIKKKIKAVIFPFQFTNKINLILEKTLLRHISSFIFIRADKK